MTLQPRNFLRFSLFLLAPLFLFSAPLRAELKASPWTKEKRYMEKAGGKLGFGFLNISVGWSSLFMEPSREKSWNGLAKGLGLCITNTVGGLLHAATFPIPVDLPLPAGGFRTDIETGGAPVES